MCTNLHPNKCVNKLEQKRVILFDGVCILCNRTVIFIIKRDKKKKFYFATLQGKTGQALLQKNNLSAGDLSSFILAAGDRIYTKSTGVLKMFRILGRGWQLYYGLIIIPPFLRDAVYKWVARKRYKWFGKKDECMVPAPDIKERFLE